MATTKPRITVTLTKRQHEVLKSIADTGGQSMSALLGEFIEVALPTFERMAATFQQVKRASDQERVRIVAALDDAQAALEPIALAAAGQFDLFLGKIDAAADAVTGADSGRAGTAAAAAKAPPTNRGDTPLKGNTSKASNGKALRGVLRKKVLEKTTS